MNSAIPELRDVPIYRQSIRHQRCANLASLSYHPAKWEPTFVPFRFPIDAENAKAKLLGFGCLEQGEAIIVFRGTANRSNLYADLNALPAGRPSRHFGFLRSWRRLQPQVEAWLRQTQPSCLILTGHSLGAAMAQLAAFDLAPDWPIEEVIGFGAPLAGWRRFARVYDSAAITAGPDRTLGTVTTTYVFKTDFVRHFMLPLLGCRPIGNTICIDDAGRTINNDLPWYFAAFARSIEIIKGPEQPVGVPAYLQPPLVGQRGLVTLTGVPKQPASLSAVVGELRPVLKPLVQTFPHLMMAVVAAWTAVAFYLSVKFARRDLGYHAVTGSYQIAIIRRVDFLLLDAYEALSQQAFAAKDFQAALDALDKALWWFKQTTQTWNASNLHWPEVAFRAQLNRAAALSLLGRRGEAIRDLTELLDAVTSRFTFYSTYDAALRITCQRFILKARAVGYENNRQFEAAIGDYTSVTQLELNPRLSYYLDFVRQAERNVGRMSGYLKLASKSRAQRVNAEFKRLGDEADAHWRRQIAPDVEWAWLQIANCSFELRRYPEAVAALTKVMDMNPKNAVALSRRGWAHWEAGEADAASADFSAAIALEPGNPDLYCARARFTLARAARRPNGAVPSDTDGIQLVSLPPAELADVERDVQKALALDPTHPVADRLMAALRQKQPDPPALQKHQSPLQ